MEQKIEALNSHTNFIKYFETETISDNTQKKLDTVDFLAVPAQHSDNMFYFAQETIDFIKFCRQNDTNHTYDILADGDIKVRSLHSFDIWLPVIWIAKEILLPIAITLVADFIKSKLKGREKEDAKVDITMIVKRKDEEKTIHYSGDAKTFKETFEKIDLNKM